ncbi:hypothetical protein ACFCYB_36235 [Streptomyces sp. NPDC056309]|uniref:hypothetical protein n=1 Tax=unclassified Streptomyces TaxID=2593676 RepID=UPI0035E061B5
MPGRVGTRISAVHGKLTASADSAAVSTWLSSGVEPQLVAQRAGHSVAVLFRVYSKFLKGGDEAANAKISARLEQQD